MTARRSGRVQRCSDADARRRLVHARQFLDVGELVAEEERSSEGLEYGNAAATLAVLAGIAAADAACCKALGKRSRADDHGQAEILVEQIAPGGNEAAKRLHGLIALKGDAQYGLHSVGRAEVTRALRHARAMVVFAEQVIGS